MKTKTYPEIGFLRLRDVIGAGSNPGIIPVSRVPWYLGFLINSSFHAFAFLLPAKQV
jgi:hypothetical protein